MKKIRLKNKYTFFIRFLLLSLFIVSTLHFISTWIYMFINPFIEEHLVSFTYLGLLINIVELFYVIWFAEYYEEKKEEYDENFTKKRENSTAK